MSSPYVDDHYRTIDWPCHTPNGAVLHVIHVINLAVEPSILMLAARRYSQQSQYRLPQKTLIFPFTPLQHFYILMVPLIAGTCLPWCWCAHCFYYTLVITLLHWTYSHPLERGSLNFLLSPKIGLSYLIIIQMQC